MAGQKFNTAPHPSRVRVYTNPSHPWFLRLRNKQRTRCLDNLANMVYMSIDMYPVFARMMGGGS